jgi:hypothetical protein
MSAPSNCGPGAKGKLMGSRSQLLRKTSLLELFALDLQSFCKRNFFIYVNIIADIPPVSTKEEGQSGIYASFASPRLMGFVIIFYLKYLLLE